MAKWIEEINNWMCQNVLQLSKDKAEVVVFGPKDERLNVSAQLQLLVLKPTNKSRNVGVVMDSDHNLNSHIKTFTKSASYHLKNISKVRGPISQQDWRMMNNWRIINVLNWFKICFSFALCFDA